MLLAITVGIRMPRGRRKELGRCNGPKFPDFNPIERVWYIMKSRIQIRRGSERVATAARMRVVLQECDRITIEEINALFPLLSTLYWVIISWLSNFSWSRF